MKHTRSSDYNQIYEHKTVYKKSKLYLENHIMNTNKSPIRSSPGGDACFSH